MAEEPELHPELAALFAAGDSVLPEESIAPTVAPTVAKPNDRVELLEVLTGKLE